MVVFVVAIIAFGFISYWTSAWFGCQSSNMSPLPPHYRKLMSRFKPDRSEDQKEPVYPEQDHYK